jgi:hypothetical protein
VGLCKIDDVLSAIFLLFVPGLRRRRVVTRLSATGVPKPLSVDPPTKTPIGISAKTTRGYDSSGGGAWMAVGTPYSGIGSYEIVP